MSANNHHEDTPISIIIEMKRLEIYVPPKILRTLGDYVNRKQVIEELKAKPAKEINWFNIVLIELKGKQSKMREGDRRGKLDYPKYSGKMFTTTYVFPFHKSVLNYYKQNGENWSYRNWNTSSKSFMELLDVPDVKCCVEAFFKSRYNPVAKKNIYDEVNGDYELLKPKVPMNFSSYEFQYILNQTFYYPQKGLIKRRGILGTMDLTKTKRNYHHPTNLKRWNKETKKPSNAGLVADHTYTWSDEHTGRSGGWTFKAISIDDIAKLYRINNRLAKDAKKDASGNKITLQYGDYADWYLHKLE